MNKRPVLSIVALLLALAAVGVLFLWTRTGAPSEVPSIVVSQLSQDLYPLYDKTEWNAPVAETFTISTSTYSGASISSVPVLNTMDPGSVFSPFQKYYDKSLKALGWKVDNYMEAGGPMGGQTGYRKNNELILVRFSTVFHTVTNTAPSECPCDVSLSLFSAK